MRSKYQWPSRVFVNIEVFKNIHEYSDIKIFQYSGKGRPPLMTDHKKSWKPITVTGNASSILKTEQNTTCVANVSDQSAEKYKREFPMKFKNKAICI
jgi:hypothetical protein